MTTRSEYPHLVIYGIDEDLVRTELTKFVRSFVEQQGSGRELRGGYDTPKME